MKFWYFTEGNKADSSYTDFTSMNNEPVSSYTDFTMAASSPVLNRSVRKAKVRNFKGSGKKSGAGKVFAGIITVIAVLFAVALGAMYYMSDNTDGGNFIKNIFVNSGSNNPNNKAGAKVIPLGHEDFPENTTKSTEEVKPEPESGERDVYDIADELLMSLKCDNDVDTAREIFNWVHSNIYYQHVSGSLTYEEAAYMGFMNRTGDCYVYFSCAKMLLDRARIPNLMVKRYPVLRNGHFWNLVQLNGEWYHCDATVFKDHPDLYFMLTDDEIADKYHEFDSSLYPERASGSFYNQDFASGDVYDYPDDVYAEPYEDDDSYMVDW